MDLFSKTKQVATKKKVVKIDPKTKRFNLLLKKIEALEAKAVTTKKQYEALFVDFKNKVEPLQNKSMELRISLSKALYNAIPKLKLAAYKQEMTINMMVDDLETILMSKELDEETIEIYETISNKTVAEVVDASNEDGLEMMIEMLRENGVEIDINKYDLEKLRTQDPETMAEFFKEINEQANSQKQQNTASKKQPKEKKKTKKQLKIDEQFAEKEAFEKRSLKTLYTSLAKVLHPDTELDEALKIEKEDWMKQLTVAYKKQDLATMIKIELYWLQNSKFDPSTALEKQFEVYVNFLSERIIELNMEIASVPMRPEYMPMLDFIDFDFKNELSFYHTLAQFKLEQEEVIELTNLLLRADSNKISQTKKKLDKYVTAYWEAQDELYDDFEMEWDDPFTKDNGFN